MLEWKYVEAAEESQKYKVGRFILETKRIKLGASWENEDDEDESFPLTPDQLNNAEVGEEEVEFDSQDEDECEDFSRGCGALNSP